MSGLRKLDKVKRVMMFCPTSFTKMSDSVISFVHAAAFPSNTQTRRRAFQDLHSQGFYRFKDAVDELFFSSVSDEMTASITKGQWHVIKNHPEGQKKDSSGEGKRSFKPASDACFNLFSDLVDKLKECGLANANHDIRLARGASWLMSVSKKKQALTTQTAHMDFSCANVLDRLQLPMSMFILRLTRNCSLAAR